MSYLFDATTERIALGTRAMPTAAGTLAVWWYPTFAQGDGINHLAFDVRADGNNVFNLVKTSANALLGGWFTASTDHRASAGAGTYTLTQNAWNRLLVTWDDTANATRLYLNSATAIASQTSTLVPFSTAGHIRYAGNLNAFLFDARGYLANLTIWAVVLGSTDRTALLDGTHPLRVNQADLVNCWDMFDSANDLGPNEDHGTATGATVDALHPATPRPSVFTPGVLCAA